MKILIGIPARYGSTRFPGKPLAQIAGKPMIVHVVERALAAQVGDVVVVTDDQRIKAALSNTGVDVRIPEGDYASGTERLAAAFSEDDADVVINVQGDEPLIEPDAIRDVLIPLQNDPRLPMSTLARPIEKPYEMDNPNIVKVVMDKKSRALYFSRAPIPFPHKESESSGLGYAHIGLYAYRTDFFRLYPSLSASPLEQAESLEQLRVLHHGFGIGVQVGDYVSLGVDTPEDIEIIEKKLLNK